MANKTTITQQQLQEAQNAARHWEEQYRYLEGRVRDYFRTQQSQAKERKELVEIVRERL